MDTEDNDIRRKDSGRKKSTFKVEKDKRDRKRKQMASIKAVRETKITGKRTRERKREMANKLRRASAEIKTTTS